MKKKQRAFDGEMKEASPFVKLIIIIAIIITLVALIQSLCNF